jgi:hypothetical protein
MPIDHASIVGQRCGGNFYRGLTMEDIANINTYLAAMGAELLEVSD